MSDFYQIGNWLGQKMKYHRRSKDTKVVRMQVNRGEIWMCDLGFNIGEEKNKIRPVVVLSSNNVNRTGKVLVAPITEARGKMSKKKNNLPQHATWFLLHSNTEIPFKMHTNNRKIPLKAQGYPISILEKDSIIQCEEMRCLSKVRLLNKKGVLLERDLKLITKQVKSVFDIL